ncbi:AAA family ATPase [Fretibacterium sp. OH1220_COT-178]|uniref:AAA family ATPase n=1 Tax=Fretibacterium sp. OH1220_COT-178 TaxID=2491047 RepID=UPI001315708A|nr:AAA family ATPase [Fretibacterium sp. OH1220_COT-178]
MLFYKIEMESDRALESSEQKMRKTRARIKEGTVEANERFRGEMNFFVSEIQDRKVSIGAAVFVEASTAEWFDLMRGLAHFCRKIELQGRITDFEETTIREFSRMLYGADRRDYIEDDDGYKSDLDMDFIDGCRCSECSEMLIPEPLTKRAALTEASRLLCGASFRPEIERIFDPRAPKNFVGNPVHYVLASDDPKVRHSMRELLLGALLQRRRLLGKRYCVLNLSPDSSYYARKLNDIYQSQKGCALVLSLTGEFAEESQYASASFEFVASLGEKVAEFRRDTLTILEMRRSDERLYHRLMEELPNITFVRLDEEIVFNRAARGYLRRLAGKNGVKDCTSLLKALPRPDSGHLTTGLNTLFDKWYDSYLKTELHVQYRNLATEGTKRVSKPKGDAYRDLMEMAGLRPVKEVILQAVRFHKAQKLFADRGIGTKRPSMHMVFAGNPGTAKTTVARLMAQIMKDNGLLSVGGLVEVGRADLVGKYVGWTAQIVKKKFREAKGSVLFIDEAYSLVDERGGLYGDEAINTIVQEMENARDDTVVVFAGYPDRMREFVERNPGLKSRVAFHVDFPDYTPDELLEIFGLILKKRGRRAGPETLERARVLLERAAGEPDFGNGRFVRNLVERAEMRQADRLLDLPPDSVTDLAIQTFLPEDLEAPERVEEAKSPKLGFA